MNGDSSLPFVLTRAKILLAVEDELTKAYLSHLCFSDAGSFYLVNAGGNNGVSRLAKELSTYKTGSVFGFIDCDFSVSNHPAWVTVQSGELFYAKVHEVENYFFDWKCFSSVVGGTSQDVEAKALDEAKKQIYWLSCRCVISEIQKLHGDGFPEHPKLSIITSHEESVRHILESDWVKNVKLKTEEVVNPGWITKKAKEAETKYSSALADGTWKLLFSGKEIFKKLLHTTTQGSLSSHDFAKKFAKAQVENGSVPSELQELAALLQRYADTL